MEPDYDQNCVLCDARPRDTNPTTKMYIECLGYEDYICNECIVG